MPEPTARRRRSGPAAPETVEALHTDLDGLWAEAGWVPETDRMAFTLAVVEAAGNVVAHAVPAGEDALGLEVEITATTSRLEAKVYEVGAAPAEVDLTAQEAADPLAEAGRGLALIQALVTTVVFQRQDNTNVWTLRRDCAPGRP